MRSMLRNPTNTLPRAASRDHTDSPLTPFEAYRASFRRVGWSANTSTKSKTFPTLKAALAFVRGKLRSAGRPDLSPIAFVTIEKRHGLVSRWEPIPGGSK